MAHLEHVMLTKAVPLTVITGYLGAGKTTLINRMLRQASAPFAVIVNDLGALPVDAALISAEAASTLTLTNGCACCQLQSDLSAQLTQLRQAGFGAVVLEASGVAKATNLVSITSQADGYQLAKIITLVDAIAVPRLMEDRYLTGVVVEQIKAGDSVYQTKAGPEITPSLLALRADARFLSSEGQLPVDIDPYHLIERSASAKTVAVTPQFQHRVVYPKTSLQPESLKVFIDRSPAVQRVKGWLVVESGTYLIQATRDRFVAQPAVVNHGAGLQFIWQGTKALDFSSITQE
jgi:G3E family GTPase